MVHEGMFDEIKRHKPKAGKKEKEILSFPLNILDVTNNIVIGQFTDKQKTQQAINRYKETKN